MNADDCLTPEDRLVFEQAYRDVRRLRQVSDAPFRPKPAPEPTQTWLDRQQVVRELLEHDPEAWDSGPAEDMSYCRAGVQKSVLRKLKKGHYCVNVALDLHGMTAPIARQAVTQFCNEARRDQALCVRIIHGKGWRSGNRGPVLKPLVARWLMRRDDVLAFCTARPVDGGSGALYVLLKRA
jgi:DNA-nicking Smr family endonuclease